MSKVLLGRNEFIECGNIFSYKGKPVLTIRVDPLRLELVTHDMPSTGRVRVDRDGSEPKDRVRIVETRDSFAIFLDQDALAVATRLDPETAHLKIDLRPLGITIYDDLDGLHIGGNVFTGNKVIRSASAISLG